MQVELSEPVAEELREVLDQVLSELSSEIADTDNPRFRVQLQERRIRLREVQAQLEGDEPPPD